MRVYEIAKEVGIPNKDLIAKIRALGLEVNNHMSSLDADDVARIKRSLEKERSAAVAPAQTQRLGSGAVLRRRSSAEKLDSDRPDVVAKEPTTNLRPSSIDSSTTPPPVVRARDSSPSITAPPPRPAPAPTPAPAPVVRRRVVEEAPPVVEERVERLEPSAPPPPPVAPVIERVAAPAPAVNHRVEAEPEVEVEPAPAPPPVAPTPPPPRPRMIVAGPADLKAPRPHTNNNNNNSEPARAAQAPAPTPAAAQSPASVAPPAAPPTAPPVAPPAPPPSSRSVVVEVTDSARTRFERELERAKQRTAARPPTSDEEPVAEVVAAAPTPPPRDPSRPAVGSVIALPPRIKITERAAPLGTRAPSGPQPANPIRGRFAQQQQQRGPRPGGPGGRPGSMDMRKKLPLGKKGKQTQLTTPAEHKRVIRIEDTIAIQDLARSMGIKAPEVLKKLWGMGMTGVNINASIDFDTAQILASEFGYEVQNVAFKEEVAFAQKADDAEQLVVRAPVVTVMGHVDHGKTSLLDAIRKTRVAAGEAGGITQHVAAYKVQAPGHGDIVFLDTPGHEAFTEMRARGAHATDIVVLVVAANDGVMPQTLEALSHAKDAKVTIIVAVNKIDLPDAQPDRVRQQLADHGLIPEEWGGETIYVNVSALRGENVDKLLESIAVTAEVLELKANPMKPGSGVVIEARLDRNRGPMATVLVQEGTLRVGDVLVAGRIFGKVRAMLDDRGRELEEAGPSTPIEVLGLDGVPEAGDQVNAAEDEKIAKQVVDHRQQQFRRRELASTARVSLESLMARMTETAGQKELKIVLKADVQGSAEALKAALTKQSTEKVKVTVISAAVGGVTESDVNLAKAGGAIIVGFHVRPAGKASKHAEQEGVQIRLYDIIYDALDEVKAAMAGLLAPIKREVAMGKLQVRQTFNIPKVGTIAGCMVTEGKITRKAHLRIIRDAVQVYEGKVGSLRRVKDDVSEVQHGFECGVMIAGWNEVKENDVIEAYEVIEEAAQL